MPKKIADIIPSILHQKNNWKINLLHNWDTILGPLAHNVQLYTMTKDTVTLGVYDSCWLQELYMLSPVLLKTINKHLDEPRIHNLRFKLIPPPHKKDTHIPTPKKIRTPKNIQLNFDEKKALNSIQDQGLKNALKSFLIRCYQEKT